MSPQPSFASFESLSGVKGHRIPVEAFPGFWAYTYVVHYDAYHYLIDCGSGTESSHSDLLNGLEQVGIQPSDLTHILLTHAHIDHNGGLSKLKPLTDAKIGCHALDVQTVAQHEARLALNSLRLAFFLAETGLAKEETETLLNIYRFTKAIYKSVPVEFTLRQAQGGAYEAMDMRVGPFEIIHLPGHCPGHVAIRLDDIIFCGDIVVEGVTPHLAPESIGPYNGLNHYLESLDRFQHWAKDARLILNGHDDVITDVTAKVEATHQNLIRRMSKAIKSLSEPLTIAGVCVAVYGETGGYQKLLVIEKTGAYIEYFYEHGLLEITNVHEVEQGMPALYRRSREISDDEILPKVKVSVVK